VTRLAYIVSHPIQYQAPLLRRLAAERDLDLQVLFLSDFSTRAYRDRGFGQSVAWDVDLVQGYPSKVLPAAGRRDIVSFWKPLTLNVGAELRRGRYDAVWLHGYAHHAQLRALVAARRLGMKVLLRGESHAHATRESMIPAPVKRRVLMRLFTQIDAFLAIGTANRDYYLSYGVEPDRIFMMPYAVDNARFQAASTLEHGLALRASLGLPASRPIILFAAKLQPRKRAWDLWTAYTRLSPDGVTEPHPALIFVGDGSQRSALEAAVAQKGWSGVRFAGFQNQTAMPRFYAAADVFVLCSENEPWALAVNEAMNAGTAVIVSDQVGAAPDLVQDGVNGFVVPVGDVATLANRLRRVTTDEALARRMGAQSLQRISRWNFEADVAGLRQALAMAGSN